MQLQLKEHKDIQIMRTINYEEIRRIQKKMYKFNACL